MLVRMTGVQEWIGRPSFVAQMATADDAARPAPASPTSPLRLLAFRTDDRLTQSRAVRPNATGTMEGGWSDTNNNLNTGRIQCELAYIL
jgi:hypothetical protein